MIIGLAALLAATSSGCWPVAGSERLWQPTTRWLIVGEMHGTNETPDAFANLVCLAAAKGRPVTVALEYSVDGQPIIDGYLASDGGAQARVNLLTLPLFTSEMPDGRGSVAFLRLFERLRLMKQSGHISGVVAFDVGRATQPGQDRNAAMAQVWSAIKTPPNGLIAVLVGNVHAMRKQIAFSNRMIVPAASLMPVDQTVTVNVIGAGGTAWNCQQDGCHEHELGPPGALVSGITYSADADRRWDATYQLGVPTTAAFPASTADGPSRPANSPSDDEHHLLPSLKPPVPTPPQNRPSHRPS